MPRTKVFNRFIGCLCQFVLLFINRMDYNSTRLQLDPIYQRYIPARMTKDDWLGSVIRGSRANVGDRKMHGYPGERLENIMHMFEYAHFTILCDPVVIEPVQRGTHEICLPIFYKVVPLTPGDYHYPLVCD